MKAKKNSKKNRTTRNNIPYTSGRNMFGEKAETHFIVLKRETAFQQIMDCISQLDGSSKEFTFDMRYVVKVFRICHCYKYFFFLFINVI